MFLRLLADLVLVAHLGFIVFAALGGLLALRWRRAPLVHLPAVAWGAYIELTGRVCPLTPLENALRSAAGGAGSAGGTAAAAAASARRRKSSRSASSRDS